VSYIESLDESEDSTATSKASRDISKFKDSNGEWTRWCVERLEGDSQILNYDLLNEQLSV